MDKQTIIVIDGHDGAGKSTIAKALSKLLDIPYYKNTYERNAFLHGEFRNLTKYSAPITIDFLRQTKMSVIIDRFYPSEFSYAQTFKREWDKDIVRILDIEAAELDVLIVLCFKTDLTAYEDDIIDKEHVKMLKDHFREFAEWTRCKKLILDTTDQNLQRQIASIMSALRLENAA